MSQARFSNEHHQFARWLVTPQLMGGSVRRHVMRLPARLILGFAALGFRAEAVPAQGTSDSLEVVRLLVAELHAEEGVERYVFRDSLPPFERRLRAALDSMAMPVGNRAIPCPWGWEESAAPFGYRLRVLDLTLVADSALVYLDFRCDNPPGYHHDLYSKSLEFVFRRGVEGWAFVGIRRMRVT